MGAHSLRLAREVPAGWFRVWPYLRIVRVGFWTMKASAWVAVVVLVSREKTRPGLGLLNLSTRFRLKMIRWLNQPANQNPGKKQKSGKSVDVSRQYLSAGLAAFSR